MNDDNTIQINSKNVRTLGRTYENNELLFFNWSASGFELKFHGSSIKAQFYTNKDYSPNEHTFLYVFVDGDEDPSSAKLIELDKEMDWYTLADNLSDDVHTIKVVKRTEAIFSQSAVKMLEISGDSPKLLAPPKEKKRKLLVLGDSISCGYGIYDVNSGLCYSNTEDALKTGAAIAAKNFDADIHIIAVSGRRLTQKKTGVPQPTIPEINKKLDYLNEFETEWDVTKYQPDIIVINLGTNDFIDIKEESDRQQFKQEYESFIRQLNSNYPKAKIICALGAMGDGGYLFPIITQAVETVNKDKINAYTYRMKPCLQITNGGAGAAHPSVEANRQYGQDLTELIQSITKWKIRK